MNHYSNVVELSVIYLFAPLLLSNYLDCKIQKLFSFPKKKNVSLNQNQKNGECLS